MCIPAYLLVLPESSMNCFPLTLSSQRRQSCSEQSVALYGQLFWGVQLLFSKSPSIFKHSYGVQP